MILLGVGATPVHALDAAPATPQTNRLWRLAAIEQATLEQRGVIVNNADLSSYLQAVAERLWKQVDTELDRPTVKVIMDTRMEAITYPNGYCYLTTGILNQLENENQLAMILAHEIVHYVCQHTIAFYEELQQTVPNASLKYADLSHKARRQNTKEKNDTAEYQADSEGLVMLKAAGYCEAEALVLMSNLIKNLENQGNTGTVDMLKHRMIAMKRLIGPSPVRSSCNSSTDRDPDLFLISISPALMANAQSAIQHGDWTVANKSISRFLRLKPHDASAYYLKGEILRRQNDGEGKKHCIGSFEKALEIDPKFPLAYRALGELYFKAGRHQIAKPYFEAFLSLAPQDIAKEYIRGYLRQCQN
jgi:predicted Zn-dependent protease